MANNNNQANLLVAYLKSLEKFKTENQANFTSAIEKLKKAADAYGNFPSATLEVRAALKEAITAINDDKNKRKSKEKIAILDEFLEQADAFLTAIPAPQFPEVEQL